MERQAGIWCRVAALAALLVMGGCASVVGGNSQKMLVQAHTADGAAVEGAECTLSNDKGSWRVRAPGDSTITRSFQAMNVRCERPPLPMGTVSVESGTRAAVFGNILIGGVIGAAIDVASGAAYEYPEMVRVVMGRSSTFTLPRGGAPGASGFAAVKDADAVPHLDAAGRAVYREWLGKPHPRAFAVAPNGQYAQTVGARAPAAGLSDDPKERALQLCERRARMPCALYAVNDNVVWTPPAPAATEAAQAPVQPVALQPVSTAAPAATARAQPAPMASGYAAIEDVDALPYLSDRGRAEYRQWLVRGTPKAFAVSTNGHWFAAVGLAPMDATLPSDPVERALVGCERSSGRSCRLYAVNGSVVWTKP